MDININDRTRHALDQILSSIELVLTKNLPVPTTSLHAFKTPEVLFRDIEKEKIKAHLSSMNHCKTLTLEDIKKLKRKFYLKAMNIIGLSFCIGVFISYLFVNA